jgi:hypothetical protein
MANLSNINNKFIVTDGGNVLIAQTNDAGFKLSVAGTVAIGADRSTYIDASEDSSATSHIFTTNAAVGDFSQLAGNLVIQARVHPSVYRDIIFAGGLNTAGPLMTITGEGNVGIGTDSPAVNLQVEAAGAPAIAMSSSVSITSGSRGDLAWYNSSVSTVANIRADTDTSATADNVGTDLAFFTRAIGGSLTQKMVIKGGGNVGIGTISPTSQLFVNNTADGDKIRWGRSDALVGSVGTYNGVPYIGYQGGAGGGIMFNGSSIEPTALGSTRSSSTNDIGSNSYKWRNIYLSGGAYLGGTGSANHLDYYEEGSWTPVISHHDGSGVIPSTNSGSRYTRIGGMVHLQAYITAINPAGNAGTSSPYYGIRGFPFAPTSITTWEMVYVPSSITSYGGYGSAASMYFLSLNSNGTNGAGHISGTVVNSWGANVYLMMSITYAIH